MTGTALKFDGGKPRMSLVERCFIEGVARVLTFGAKKYAARNYRNGAEISRFLDAALRHLVAFCDGEDTDAESGESHLYHCACCLMMADWMHKHRPDLDNRSGATAEKPQKREVCVKTFKDAPCVHGEKCECPPTK